MNPACRPLCTMREPAFSDIDGAVMQILMGRALGLTVKRWMDGGGDSVPAEFRAALQQLH